MKGVILSINPEAQIVDITHDVEPQDVREAAFLPGDYYRFFPEGTVHVCIVDPTVGSSRRPIILAARGHLFVGPDNGLFSLLYGNGVSVREITNRRFMLEQVSATFHGRDVFAPAAAHLSRGVDVAELGPPIDDPVLLSDLFPSEEGGVMTGRIVRIDRFGNAISNITAERLHAFVHDRSMAVEIGGLSFRELSTSYYEGTYTCLIGSTGYLEFGLFNGSFAESKRVRKGDRVRVTV
jgi:S-adenosylmethionine hydrolase